MPNFQQIPKAAYYFSKKSGALRQDEPTKHKGELTRAGISNQPHTILVSAAKNTRFSGCGRLSVRIQPGPTNTLMIPFI